MVAPVLLDIRGTRARDGEGIEFLRKRAEVFKRACGKGTKQRREQKLTESTSEADSLPSLTIRRRPPAPRQRHGPTSRQRAAQARQAEVETGKGGWGCQGGQAARAPPQSSTGAALALEMAAPPQLLVLAAGAGGAPQLDDELVAGAEGAGAAPQLEDDLTAGAGAEGVDPHESTAADC